MTDIVAELRRKIGDRDGDDGVIGVTFGEMRSLLDVVEAAEGYREYSIHSIEGMEYERRLDAALDALAALERSDEE